MSWWRRLTGGSRRGVKPQRLDYLNEALALERQGDYDAALTSYRLALRDQPANARILANMAIAFSKVGQQEEAIRAYRRALALEPALPGAHYGLAFLLLRRGEIKDAAYHLDSFLTAPPSGTDTARWIEHARETLDRIQSNGAPEETGLTKLDGPP